MNWGDIQIESLKKMFLNNDSISRTDLSTLKEDKKYKTYLLAMPQACNEAINYILENGKPLIKEYKLKWKETNHKYKLNDVISNFKRIWQIVCDCTTQPDWYIEGDNVLVVKNWLEDSGDITIYYESYHDMITSSTSSTTQIDLNYQLVSLIPLYIAGELYKDDDIQLSTIYMNEFVTNVSNLSNKDFNPNPKEIVSTYEVEW